MGINNQVDFDVSIVDVVPIVFVAGVGSGMRDFAKKKKGSLRALQEQRSASSRSSRRIAVLVPFASNMSPLLAGIASSRNFGFHARRPCWLGVGYSTLLSMTLKVEKK